ncbi:F-box protein At5g07610-like [Cornus florida]|uniref:F-box protein At5g07610-like n=1 Tax=Cornus florida TaxID=4283 RepID=UPI0028A087C0|nr:F-box protein At5g07610-like [Cornus florida]
MAASTAAAEIIGGNKKLAVEILQRLPAKSLIRFKSVSKAWLSFISAPRFSLLWQSHHHPKVSGLFFNPRSRPETIKYVPLTHSDDLRNQCDIATVINGGEENNSPAARIIDSRNGFLLVYFSKLQSCSSVWRESYSYHVYNPTTKQFSTLPWPFPVTFTSFLGDNVYLVFDPLKSLHYKVVLVIKASEPGSACSIQIHIYSSETNDWRRSPLNGDFHSVDLSEGVYCNGSIHWLSFREEKTSLYWDVDQERFCPMPSPPHNYTTGFKCRNFGEFGGHLHYIRYYDNMGFNVNVLEMESDYSKWTPKYSTTMVVDLSLEVVRMDTALSLIHVEDEGDVFLVLLVRTEMNYMIISYNIKENTFKKRVDVPRHPIASWKRKMKRKKQPEDQSSKITSINLEGLAEAKGQVRSVSSR